MEEQGEPGRLEKGFFLDRTRFSILVKPEKAFLDTSEDVKPGTVIFDTGKKLCR